MARVWVRRAQAVSGRRSAGTQERWERDGGMCVGTSGRSASRCVHVMSGTVRVSAADLLSVVVDPRPVELALELVAGLVQEARLCVARWRSARHGTTTGEATGH